MKKFIATLVFIGIASLAVTQTALGQSLSSYLQGKTDAVLRIEVSAPQVIPPTPTFWTKIKGLLGIRQVTRIKPPVGTKLIVQASAYASSPYQTDSTPCITAAGTRVRPGVVATNFLPMGTLLAINGLRFIVEDRMNSRYAGYFMDIWFPSTSTALTFGRKNIEIVIVGYGEPGQEIRPEEPSAKEAAEQVKGSIGFWGRVKDQLASIGDLLGARNAVDVNKYDIDCLSEKQNG